MLLVELEPAIDPVVNERAILLASRLRDRNARGVRDIAPGYCTLGVHYDPLQTDLAALEQAIEREFAALASLEAVAARSAIEIPVNYGGEHGPDLAAVATHAGCSTAEVIKRQTGVSYHPGYVWYILRKQLGWTWQRPSRRAVERDEEAIEQWVKQRWPQLKKEPGASTR